MAQNELIGNVINVQKFTVHDGPGIRTEVFLKGCPLRCLWCSNPESIKPHSEVGVFAKDCIGFDKCGWCIEACPHGAIVVKDNKVESIDRLKCKNCLACAKACPNDTLKIFGKAMTVGEVMKLVKDDRFFYDRSNGGLTVSGGDALVQWEFTLALIKESKRVGIHTCVETELHCQRYVLDEIMPYTDMMIADIKHMDSKMHKRFTGVGNERILDNLRYIASTSLPLILRLPVVPGHNDCRENIEATTNFILKDIKNNIRQLQLLPYRLLGVEKYDSLGLEYPMKDQNPPKREIYEKAIRNLAEEFRSYGIPAAAGTTVKIK